MPVFWLSPVYGTRKFLSMATRVVIWSKPKVWIIVSFIALTDKDVKSGFGLPYSTVDLQQISGLGLFQDLFIHLYKWGPKVK